MELRHLSVSDDFLRPFVTHLFFPTVDNGHNTLGNNSSKFNLNNVMKDLNFSFASTSEYTDSDV